MLIGVTLAIVLSLSFSSLAQFFTKDSNVLQIVKSGILVSICNLVSILPPYLICQLMMYAIHHHSQFVSASQPINAIAFIFDGLHYGVSDFSYVACSMVCCTVIIHYC